jgi:hypothetical protein
VWKEKAYIVSSIRNNTWVLSYIYIYINSIHHLGWWTNKSIIQTSQLNTDWVNSVRPPMWPAWLTQSCAGRSCTRTPTTESIGSVRTDRVDRPDRVVDPARALNLRDSTIFYGPSVILLYHQSSCYNKLSHFTSLNSPICITKLSYFCYIAQSFYDFATVNSTILWFCYTEFSHFAILLSYFVILL